MPEWVDLLLKAGPLVGAIVVGLLQLYLSSKFAEFRERMDQKLDVMEKEIDRKYPARDLIEAVFKGFENRMLRVERKVDRNGRE